MTKLIDILKCQMTFLGMFTDNFNFYIENGITDHSNESFKKPMGSVETARYRDFLTPPVAVFNIDRGN